MYGLDRKRYFWVGISAVIQGLLLGRYSYTFSGPFLALPTTLVIIVPLALWLAQEHWGRRLMRFLAALTAILTVLYLYWLWSVYPADGEFYYLPTQNMNLARAGAAVFLLLPFFQCRIAMWSWRVPYSEVFFQLCRNVFLMFQSLIVTAVFWGLLLTASLLFEIIGLDFVPQIVFNPLVAFPVTSLTIAMSITLALKHPGIDSLGRWILSILAWLLPPFSLLSAVFVVSLPFSGLKTLWNTGQASSLMLLLQFATILLANAAWLDGTRTPFKNSFVDASARLSLLCLPIYTTLCLYSLGLRIQQYGWSVDRIHAAFFVVFAGIWGLGYAGIVLLRQWPAAIGRINTAAAVLLASIVVAMNSPLLDPYRLSADNQVERLLSGKISPENFDFFYLRFNLGRYGNYALSRLQEMEDASKAEVIREHLDAALSVNPKEHWENTQSGLIPEKQRRDILAGSAVYPEGSSLSPSLTELLVRQWGLADFYFLRDVRKSSDLAFSFKDVGLENDREELILLKSGVGFVFDIDSDDLRLAGVIHGLLEPSFLASQDFEVVEPYFKDLELNGFRFRIAP